MSARTRTITRRDWLRGAAAGGTTAAISSLGLGIQSAVAQSGPRYGIVGNKAPELEVGYWIDEHGKPSHFSVTQARGKWVYLKCFQNWCPGCHSHGFPTLKQVADAFYDDDRVAVVGLQTVFEGFSTNNQEAVRALQLRYELPITMGHDPGDPNGDHRPSTMRNYRTGGTPWMIVIDPSGTVVYNNFGIDPDKFISYLKSQLA